MRIFFVIFSRFQHHTHLILSNLYDRKKCSSRQVFKKTTSYFCLNLIKKLSIFILFCIFIAPYIAPPNLMHDIYNETSIFISWLPISSSQVPGKLLGYRIRYRLYHEYHNNVIKIDVDQYTQNKMINNLKPFSLYWLEVTGFTIAGEGPKSIVIINTPPGG